MDHASNAPQDPKGCWDKSAGSESPSLVRLLKDFTQDTSMHGLGRVVSSRYLWLRGLWALFVLAGAAVAAYNVAKVIMIFSTYPVATVVSLEFASTVQFPAVTICNLNMLRQIQWDTSVHLEKLREPEIQEQTTQAGTRGNTTDSDGFLDLGETLEDGYRIQEHLDSLDKAIRKEFGHQLEAMLLRCYYHETECTPLNFTQFYNARYGNCYTFNREQEAKSVVRPGPLTGLKLLLNVEEEEYTTMTHTTGFKVVVHPHSTMPFPEDEGMMVSPGFETNIAITKTDIQRTESPYGKCVNYGRDQYERNMYALEFGVGYSDKVMAKSGGTWALCWLDLEQTLLHYPTNLFVILAPARPAGGTPQVHARCLQACQMTCYQTAIYHRCGCCDRDYPCYLTSADGKGLDADYCNYTDVPTVLCTTEVEDDFTNDNLGCAELCHPACRETTYMTEVSTGRWPSTSTEDKYVKELKHTLPDTSKTIDADYVRNNIAKVNVYFKQLNYQKIETSPAYDWSRLLSDLGGQFGLWLGFSLLTALEIIQLIYDVSELLAKRLCCRSGKTQPENSPISISQIN